MAPAEQQPGWDNPATLQDVRRTIGTHPPLVTPEQVLRLRALLAAVANGRSEIVQMGDCAEDPGECSAWHVARKTGLVEVIAGCLKQITGRPVLRAGRIAGQFGKPRSRAKELVGASELPSYRGHMVNLPEPEPRSRQPNPRRLLDGYLAAQQVMHHLGWHGPLEPGVRDPRDHRPLRFDPEVWTSHEALLLDYEVPMVRRTPDGLLLGSTHWPWVGERTRHPDGAHVELLAAVMNPVASKVGPAITREQLLAVCARLDPDHEPGRLTLISRMGADAVAERLPELVTAVRDAGHPVIWLCDPMHANTVTTNGGLKTRFTTDIAREIAQFKMIVRAAGLSPGGLHLETTPDDVLECVADATRLDRVGDKSTTLCDPRLNAEQAMSVVSAWAD